MIQWSSYKTDHWLVKKVCFISHVNFCTLQFFIWEHFIYIDIGSSMLWRLTPSRVPSLSYTEGKSIPLGSLDPGSKDPDLDPFFRKWSDLRSFFQGGSKTGSRSFSGAFWKRSDPISTFYCILVKMQAGIRKTDDKMIGLHSWAIFCRKSAVNWI